MDADDAATPHPSSASSTELLFQSLEESRRLGFLGSRPIAEVVAHARYFVEALSSSPARIGPASAVLDLGAGGGVPGLVIAHDLPDVTVTMLDRRRTRTDFLSRVVRRLEWSDRVDVLTQDADQPAPSQQGAFDAAVARGFGPPDLTLRIAARWVRPGGLIVISEPPTGDRWADIDTSPFAVDRTLSPSTHVAIFTKR